VLGSAPSPAPGQGTVVKVQWHAETAPGSRAYRQTPRTFMERSTSLHPLPHMAFDAATQDLAGALGREAEGKRAEGLALEREAALGRRLGEAEAGLAAERAHARALAAQLSAARADAHAAAAAAASAAARAAAAERERDAALNALFRARLALRTLLLALCVAAARALRLL
jgi:hypothetical protein